MRVSKLEPEAKPQPSLNHNLKSVPLVLTENKRQNKRAPCRSGVPEELVLSKGCSSSFPWARQKEGQPPSAGCLQQPLSTGFDRLRVDGFGGRVPFAVAKVSQSDLFALQHGRQLTNKMLMVIEG